MFQIPRRKQRCQCCDRRFDPGSDYVSCLIEDESAVFKREDFCLSCFLEKGKQQPKSIYWRTMIPEKKGVTTGDEWMESFLERQESDDTLSLEEAYFLALFLMRKKAILFRSEYTTDTGVSLMMCERPETGEVFAVKRVSGINLRDVEARLFETVGR